MLVDDDGQCLTQRTLPRMVLITPRFDGEDLMVEAPEMPPLLIRSWRGEGDSVPVRIWQDELRVPHPDPAYSEWFSSFLRQRCRLVHLPNAVVRPIGAPHDKPPWRVNLADEYPLLLIGEASIELLNEKLQAPVTMARFRPNLVIAESGAHEEDGWRLMRIGEVELAISIPCKRCAIPLVNPMTAETGVEPLKTLATYRTVSNRVVFGQKALVTTPGVLRIGERVELMSL